MNTNQLKKFAQGARLKLLEQVAAKLDYVLTHDTAELRGKAETVRKLKEELNSVGQTALVDKVAYIWFNRLIALRFMDANGYQPLGISIVSPSELTNSVSPQILEEAHAGNIPTELNIKKSEIMDILDGRVSSNNPDNDVFRLLLVAACNQLSNSFPFLFERINDYTELLLPDDLTSPFSIIKDVLNGMSAEDCKEVEIIGWLYQFYISEKKDEVFASKTSVKKEDIPAATQLFTPRWIVEYMVQNTVGKLWLQNKPNSNLREVMPYFIESASLKTDDYLKINSVEEITLLDQASGSGHILVYGFELLYKIYEEEGYNPNEIPELIITKNLHGFEIDERAAQLASLALMMKARSYNRSFLRKEFKPNILCYKDVTFTNEELTKVLTLTFLDKSDEFQHDIKILEQATNYGSLILPRTSESFLTNGLVEINKVYPKADIFEQNLLDRLSLAIKQLIPLSKKYHCIVDNPPYMGGGNMNKILGDFVKLKYPDSKADLMTCFMEAGWNMLLPKGVLGMINLPSWLFLSSFEKLRAKLIKKKHIDSLLHMGRGIFGVDWGSTAFIIQNQEIEKESYYFKLHKRNFQHLYPEDIQQIFLKAKNTPLTKINFDKYREGEGTTSVEDLVDENGLQISYRANQKDFEKIPGIPIGYWLSNIVLEVFKNSLTIKDISEPRAGLQTGDNEKFLRVWSEVDFSLLGFDMTKDEANESNLKWFPYNKGGAFKKWYGNREFVINWHKDGKDLREDKLNKLSIGKCLPGNSKPHNSQYYFRESITWSFVSSGTFGVRYSPKGSVYDIAGSSVFPEKENVKYLCAFLNSKLSFEFLKVLAPTINFQVGDIKRLPIIFSNESKIEKVNEISSDIIDLVKLEYNSIETSWDFHKNELIRINGQDLEETYYLYQQYWQNKFFQIHKNEEEINRQFIEIYGLQDELTPDVPLEDITILKQETSIENGQLIFNATEVFAQFMSYAVGCMFGRYSLDKEGLILANQGESLKDYLVKVAKTKEHLSFLPDEDNIIPVLDDEWFEDDIVARFYAFLKASFGENQFQKNLAFIEDSLGKDIRKYFTKDFYPDHIKRYKKRPIYWMFSSPKGSFNVLIYLHRYTPDTLNKILNSYLREFIEKLTLQRKQFEHIQTNGTPAEQNKATKEIDKIDVKLADCKQYEIEILYPLASERIGLDLDDGVLVNYNKLGKAVAEVAGLNDKATKKKVKEFDWIDTTQIK